MTPAILNVIQNKLLTDNFCEKMFCCVLPAIKVQIIIYSEISNNCMRKCKSHPNSHAPVFILRVGKLLQSWFLPCFFSANFTSSHKREEIIKSSIFIFKSFSPFRCPSFCEHTHPKHLYCVNANLFCLILANNFPLSLHLIHRMDSFINITYIHTSCSVIRRGSC